MSTEMILTFLFSTIVVVNTAAFVPQIYTLITATGRSMAVSIPSYLIWSYCACVAMLYGAFVLHDIMMTLANVFSKIGNLTVVALTVYNRYYRFPANVVFLPTMRESMEKAA